MTRSEPEQTSSLPNIPDDVDLAFDHVAQQVPSVAEAVDGYHRLLPAVRVLYQDDTWAFLDAGGVKLAFIQEGHHPDHIAWRVPDEQLDRLAKGLGKSVRPHRDGTRSFYVEAPAGRWVEFISYPPSAQY